MPTPKDPVLGAQETGQPTLGRIVHMTISPGRTLPNVVYPAIVIAVNEKDETVDLQLLSHRGADLKVRVPKALVPTLDHWHWPVKA